ncbi:uncharacterized protein LOC144769303 [Lissotriton helveticus]
MNLHLTSSYGIPYWAAAKAKTQTSALTRIAAAGFSRWLVGSTGRPVVRQACSSSFCSIWSSTCCPFLLLPPCPSSASVSHHTCPHMSPSTLSLCSATLGWQIKSHGEFQSAHGDHCTAGSVGAISRGTERPKEGTEVLIFLE